VLPFIVGITMILTGTFLPLFLMPILGILAIRFSGFLLFIFPLVCGWRIGTLIITWFYDSNGWYYGGGLIGMFAMFCICSIMVAVITTPPPPQ